MTDLYKEALLEARKLKEIAQEDATKSIIDAISPYIKNVISKQISESSNVDFLVREQDDALPASSANPQDASTNPMDTAGMDLKANPVAGDAGTTVPITAGGEDVVNAKVDSDGKLIVDFEDLFANGLPSADDDSSSNNAPITPAGDVLNKPEPISSAPSVNLPVPETDISTSANASSVPPSSTDMSNVGATTGELEDEEDKKFGAGTNNTNQLPTLHESYNKWNYEMLKLTEKVDRIYFSTKDVPSIMKESVKLKLFDLMNSLDKLKNSGKIDSKQFKINENKLEFLFLKLKNNNNTENSKDIYENKETQKDKENMTTLKEYAAKLFEESLEDINKETTADSHHAAKVSGVSPGVKLHQDNSTVRGTSLPNTGKAEQKPWSEAEATVSEAGHDVISEALEELEEDDAGDADLDVSEAELMEAIKVLKAHKSKTVKESTDEKWPGTNKIKDNPAKENLKNKNSTKDALKQPKLNGDTVDVMKENADEDLDSLVGPTDHDNEVEPEENDSLDSFTDEEFHGDEDGDIVLNIDLPDEVEDALADVPVEAFDDISVSLADVNLGSHEEEESDEDDDVSMFGSDDEEEHKHVPGTETDEELDECLSVEPGKNPAVGKAGGAFKEPSMMSESKKKMALVENKLKVANKTLESTKKEVATLKSELNESNLFLAKNVYFTKFLQRGDLSKSNLSKIADHLDRAKTVNEAKDIYLKIKNKLNESAVATKKLTGSSSQVTKSGSASLNESVNHDSDNGLVIESSRWQKLAGIKAKKIND